MGNEKQAFILTRGDKYFILTSDKKNITKNIALQFIDAICDYKHFCNDLRKRIKSDNQTLKSVQQEIYKCTFQKIKNDKLEYYKIIGKNFIVTIPQNEYECLIFIR